MKLRTVALALALACGLTVAAEAKTKNVRRTPPTYKAKKFKNKTAKSRNKTAKARKIRPAVRRPKTKHNA